MAFGSFKEDFTESIRKLIEAQRDNSVPVAPPPPRSMSLTGFDMVWAVTQDTVNSQLEWLQLSGVIPSVARIGTLETDGLMIGGDGDDRATIAAPIVDFDTASSRTARMLITFTGGNVSYFSGFGPRSVVKKSSVAG